MKKYMEERVLTTGKLIAETGCTVREAAKEIGVSKSTVFKDVTKRLPKVDMELHGEVRERMMVNKKERSERGGMATAMKYRLM